MITRVTMNDTGEVIPSNEEIAAKDAEQQGMTPLERDQAALRTQRFNRSGTFKVSERGDVTHTSVSRATVSDVPEPAVSVLSTATDSGGRPVQGRRIESRDLVTMPNGDRTTVGAARSMGLLSVDGAGNFIDAPQQQAPAEQAEQEQPKPAEGKDGEGKDGSDKAEHEQIMDIVVAKVGGDVAGDMINQLVDAATTGGTPQFDMEQLTAAFDGNEKMAGEAAGRLMSSLQAAGDAAVIAGGVDNPRDVYNWAYEHASRQLNEAARRAQEGDWTGFERLARSYKSSPEYAEANTPLNNDDLLGVDWGEGWTAEQRGGQIFVVGPDNQVVLAKKAARDAGFPVA